MGESMKTCTRKNIPLYGRCLYKHHILCISYYGILFFLIAYESSGDGNGVSVFNSLKAQVKLLILMEY